MKRHQWPSTKLLTAIALSTTLAACANQPTRPDGADQLRETLTRLQSDPQLANRAAVAIKEAESAVIAAEARQSDPALGDHLVIVADRKLKIAEAQAQSRLLEDQRVSLSEQRERSRLDSRTREVDDARRDGMRARQELDESRQELDLSRQKMEELQRQVVELNARPTERGLVVTLGDVQFSTGKSQLREGVSQHLERLASFLQDHRDRRVIIEGHTDSQGSDQLNKTLSKQRAESVRAYLISQGIDPNRLDTEGKGSSAPVASNESPAGRQQNRRVEIVVVDADSMSR